MSIPVLINGAFGRMGLIATQAVNSHPHLELVGQTGREYDLLAAIKDSGAKVVIDVTHPSSVYQNALTIIAAGAHPVIGTSGLKENEIKALEKKCQELKLGGLLAPNFSLGAVLMMKYAQVIAKFMPHVEIIEMHHNKKADNPSGTALCTADLLKAANPAINQNSPDSHETLPGARGANAHGIPIHAVRLPGLLAYQQIIFGETGETLTLTHNSIDRSCFIPGICLACEAVVKLDHLVAGLDKLI